MSNIVLFQAIQFSISTRLSSTWPINRTQSDATTPGQDGPGSDGNKGVLSSPQSSSITEASLSDCLVSYPGQSLRSLTPLWRCSRCILLPQPTGPNYCSFIMESFIIIRDIPNFASVPCMYTNINVYIYIYIYTLIYIFLIILKYIHKHRMIFAFLLPIVLSQPDWLGSHVNIDMLLSETIIFLCHIVICWKNSKIFLSWLNPFDQLFFNSYFTHTAHPTKAKRLSLPKYITLDFFSSVLECSYIFSTLQSLFIYPTIIFPQNITQTHTRTRVCLYSQPLPMSKIWRKVIFKWNSLVCVQSFPRPVAWSNIWKLTPPILFPMLITVALNIPTHMCVVYRSFLFLKIKR